MDEWMQWENSMILMIVILVLSRISKNKRNDGKNTSKFVVFVVSRVTLQLMYLKQCWIHRTESSTAFEFFFLNNFSKCVIFTVVLKYNRKIQQNTVIENHTKKISLYEQFYKNWFFTSFQFQITSLKTLFLDPIYNVKPGKKVLQKLSFYRKEVKNQFWKNTMNSLRWNFSYDFQ